MRRDLVSDNQPGELFAEELDVDLSSYQTGESTLEQTQVFELPDDVTEIYAQARRRGILFGSLGLLLKKDVVYEIVEHAKVTPMPGVLPVFKGIVNHRGNIVPVYDLNELLHDQQLNWERSRIIILNEGRDSVALHLYSLPIQISPVVNVREGEVQHVPEIITQNSAGVYRLDGVLWFDLENDDLFSSLRDSSLFDKQGDGLY